MLKSARVAVALASLVALTIGSSQIAAAEIPAPLVVAQSPVAADAAPSPEMGDYPLEAYAAAADQLPPQLDDALADVGLTGEEYLAGADAATDATAVVDALTEARGDSILGSRMEGTELIVSVAGPTDVAAVEDAGATAEIGAPENLTLNLDGAAFAQDLDGGEPYYFENGGSGYRCSVGFNGFVVSTGAARFATAGHCDASDLTQPYKWIQYTSGVGLNVPSIPSASIGTPVAGSFQIGGGYDVGLVNVNSTYPRAWVAQPRVVTSSPSSAKTTTYVRDQAPPIIGAAVCKSGSTTGWTCGYIIDLGTANVGGSEVDSIITDACVNGGDSGGSLLMGNVAVGITSWATDVSVCSSVPGQYYSGFSMLVYPADSAVSTAAKKYAGAWEPAVAVNVPTVASPAAGSTVTVGSTMTGSLAAGNVRHTVEVYFDGSSTPTSAAVATDGTWSVSLSALSAGPHSYQVKGRWGTWSKSALSSSVSFTIAGSTISGHVGGTGQANASGICVDAVRSGSIAGSATTGSSGNYSIANLPGGTYTMHFTDCPIDGSIYEDQWWSGKDNQGVADTFTVAAGASVTGKNAALVTAGPFLDVRNSHTFATQISWMYSAGISTGWTVSGGVEYRPAVSVSRGAMAAFLYRLSSSPAFTAPETPSFADVPTNHPFYVAIEWMKAQGITTGSLDNGVLVYKPEDAVSRQAMAAFLYRLAGSPAASEPTTASFTDVPLGAPFFSYIEWMKAAGISTGYNDGGGLASYHPGEAVSRAAMAAFLSRFSALP